MSATLPPMRHFTRWGLYALLLLVVAGGLDAQTFEDRTRVLEIQVPVTVVDKDGRPVRGLTAHDFELLDDGERRPITGFRATDLQQLVAEEGRLRPLLQAMPSAARRHFLLLFDLSFSSTSAIVRAREAAHRFVLDQLHPTDLVAVATFSNELGPRLLVTFTPDRAQLARAVDLVGRQHRSANADPLRFLVAALPQPSNRLDTSTIARESGAVADSPFEDAVSQQRRILNQRFERTERQLERREITAWSRTLGELAKTLNAVSGRKQVLYFSEGFDGHLMLGRRPTGTDTAADADNLNIIRGQNWQVDTDEIFGNTGLQTDINEMLREFRRADCVIQAIDIGGLRAGGDVRQTIGNRGQESLFVMANGTGGDLFDNANDLNAQLSHMLRRSEVTYILSFQPKDLELDGRYHRLRVKLIGRRGRVSHRAGYYAPRPYPELAPLEKTLLAGDAIASAAPRQDLGIDLLAVSFMASAASAYVPVILEVEGESLLAGHGRQELNLEIYAYVTDDTGQMRDFFHDAVRLDASGNRKALRNGGLKYYGHLELPRGEYLVRVLVRDTDSGRAGVGNLPLSVPGLEGKKVHLLPPLFLDAPGRWVLAKEAPQESRQETMVYPFTVKGQPFIPAARPALLPRQKAELCLVAYNLADGVLELSGRVLDVGGNEVKGGRLTLAERTVTGISDMDKLLATFSPQGLKAGDYTLEVALRQAGWEAPQVSALPFRVAN